MIKAIKYTKIVAESKVQPNERIAKIQGFQHNNRLTDVSEFNDKGKKMLKVDFVFTTTFNPPICVISIEGYMLIAVIKGELSPYRLAQKWRSNGELPKNIAMLVASTSMLRGIQKACHLTEQLGLPPPIAPPKIQGGKKPSKRKGNDSRVIS